ASRAYTASRADYTADLVATRLEAGRIIEAFEALEEGRAQGLLELLLERGLPQATVDSALWIRYVAAEGVLQRAGEDLAAQGDEEAKESRERPEGAGAVAADAEQRLARARQGREAAQSKYTRARVEQERILAEIRRSVPGLEAGGSSLAHMR